MKFLLYRFVMFPLLANSEHVNEFRSSLQAKCQSVLCAFSFSQNGNLTVVGFYMNNTVDELYGRVSKA